MSKKAFGCWALLSVIGLVACAKETPVVDTCDACPSGTLCKDGQPPCMRICNNPGDCEGCDECRDGFCYHTVDFCVKDVIPADGTTDVPLNQVVRITFSESVVDNALQDHIGVSNGTNDVDVSLSLNEKVVTLTPQGLLNKNTAYQVWVDTNVGGASGAKLQQRFESSFTTMVGPALDPGPQRFLVSPVAGKAEGGGYTLYVVGGSHAGTASGGGYQVVGGEAFWR